MLTNHRWLILATLLTTAACSSQIGAGPCDGPNPSPSCGVDCSGDSDCDQGFHCSDSNTCYAQCTPSGGECGDNYHCDSQGRCQPGSQADAYSCPNVRVTVEAQIPTVQLLIDQSGSMTENFGGVSRWRAVRDALVHPSNGVVSQLQDRVNFGATLYSSVGGSVGGRQCPILHVTPYALNNFESISDLLYSNSPSVDTPTAESLTAVADAFPAPNAQAPGPRIIVLATDGDPDTCVDPDAHNRASQELSEAAVQDAYARGIQVFVLSVGNDVSLPHLQRMANAGVGEPLETGTAPFYVANNSAELVGAFGEIIRGVRTCAFTVNGYVAKPESGIVELNGEQLEYGTQWTMPNDRTLELLGESCETFLNEDNADLTAEFDCSVIVL